MVCDQVSSLCIHSSIVISSTKVQKKATHTSSCVQIQNPNSPWELNNLTVIEKLILYYEAWINMGSFRKELSDFVILNRPKIEILKKYKLFQMNPQKVEKTNQTCQIFMMRQDRI